MTKTRHNEDYEKDPRSSAEVVREYRESLGKDSEPVSLAVVHYRGGSQEFELGARYTLSGDPLDRLTGVDVLGQLGWGDRTFLDESVAILIQLLADADPQVIAAAAAGLGHRGSAAAIPHLLPLASHPNAAVRLGVVHGLSRHDNTEAVGCLAQMCADADEDVRNWAAFGVGSMCDLDGPLLREALLPLLNDSDPEIRGEALIGLAKRKDPRVKHAIVRELRGEFHGSWCLEAAELLADRDLLPLLEDLQARVQSEDDAIFPADFERAITACRA